MPATPRSTFDVQNSSREVADTVEFFEHARFMAERMSVECNETFDVFENTWRVNARNERVPVRRFVHTANVQD